MEAALKMPGSYALMDKEEMEYIESGYEDKRAQQKAFRAEWTRMTPAQRNAVTKDAWKITFILTSGAVSFANPIIAATM